MATLNQKLVNRLALALPWLLTLWLILMCGLYVTTAIDAFRHPFTKGHDLFWAKLCIGFAVVVVLSHLLIRRRLITMIWLALELATAVAMMFLSNQLTAALITAWILFLSWAWGDWTLGKLKARKSDWILDNVAVAVPLGLALMGLVTLALNLTRLLTPKWAWLAFSLLTVIQWRFLSNLATSFYRWYVSDRPFKATAPIAADTGSLLVLMGLVFLLDLSWALALETQYDALSAHLPTAQLYVEHPIGLASYTSYVANLINLHFAMALSLHGQTVAKLIVLASSLLSAVGVCVLGRMFFSTRVGLWAAAIFFTTPLVSWISTTTYIDAGVTMFLLACLIAFFRWRENGEIGWLWASGLLTGAAIAAKFNALLGMPVMGLVLLWDLSRSPQTKRQRLRAFAGYILGVVIVAGPGMWLAYALTGNPFYPLPILAKLFKSSSGPAVSLISNSNIFGIGTSPMALLKLPFVFVFNTTKFGEALPNGGIGFALVLLPLALALLLSKERLLRRQVAVLLSLCVVYIGGLAFIMQYGRYYIPVLPVIAVLAVAPFFHFSKPKWLLHFNLALLGVVIITQVALTSLMYWNIPERYPLRMAFGLETRESLLARSLRLYDPIQVLNSRVRPGHKVLSVGGDLGRIYLNVPMLTYFDPEVRQIELHSTPETFASNLIRHGITHLFVNDDSWQSKAGGYFLNASFLKRFADIEFVHNKMSIYRFRDIPVEPGAVANLLSNPGFEVLSADNYPEQWFAFGSPRVSQSNAQAHSGKIAIGATPVDKLITRVPVETNKIYSLGHWCRADKPGQLARLQINWLDAGSNLVSYSIDAVECGPKWEWHRFPAMSPAGAAFAEVHASVYENSEVWLDDFVFVSGDLPANQ